MTYDVEISIVTHCNRDLLQNCLNSLPHACPEIAWHATVVDNATTDGTDTMVGSLFPLVQVIRNGSPLGYGANQNQVLQRIVADQSARYVVAMNDDVELDQAAVTAMVRRMDQDESIGGLVPRIVDAQGQTPANRCAYPTPFAAWRRDLLEQEFPPDPFNGWLQGCCLILRVSALRETGLFDERFYLFYEDIDLSRRLEQAGWSIAACPEASVTHFASSSVLSPAVAGLTPRQGLRSRYLYFHKYLGPRRAFCIAQLSRGIFAIRAAKNRFQWSVSHRPARLHEAHRLWELATFDPRSALFTEGLPTDGVVTQPDQARVHDA